MHLERSPSVSREPQECSCDDFLINEKDLSCGKERLKSRRAVEKVPVAVCSLERQVKGSPADPGSGVLTS